MLLSVLGPILSGIIGVILFSPVIALHEEAARGISPLPAGDERLVVADTLIVLIGYTAFSYLLVWALLRFWEERPMRSLGLEGAPGWRLVRGWLAGAASISVLALALVLTGTGDITLTAHNFPVGMLLAGFLILPLAWLVQAGTEEALYRGLLLQTAGRRYGLAAGIILSSVFFALMHLANGVADPLFFTGIFMLAVFLALYAIAENSLWGVAGFHAAWNFGQICLWGLTPVSEDVADNTVMMMLARVPRLAQVEASQTAISLAAIGVAGALVTIAFFVLVRDTRHPHGQEDT